MMSRSAALGKLAEYIPFLFKIAAKPNYANYPLYKLSIAEAVINSNTVDVSAAIKHVLAGQSLLKFWRYSHLPRSKKPRFFRVHSFENNYYLTWESKKKGAKNVFTNESHTKSSLHAALIGGGVINFADITDIRQGHESAYLQKQRCTEKSVEIQYKGHRFLRFLCPDEDSWQYWLVGLVTLKSRIRTEAIDQKVSSVVHHLWELLTEVDNCQLADQDGIISLFKDMNLRCDLRYFILLCKDPSEVEFLEFERLVTSKDLLEAFHKASDGADVMKHDQLVNFFEDIQKEKDAEKCAIHFIQSIPSELSVPSGVSDLGFARAIMSPANTIWDPQMTKRGTQPLNKGVSSYLIKSFFNPCLSRKCLCIVNSVSEPWNEVTGLNKLRQVIQDGYRCLEFDVYEAFDGSIVIPSCAKPAKFIPLEKVLRLCKEEIFKRIELPFFLFLSIDASLAVCAEIGHRLKSVFGKDLLQLSELAKHVGDKSEGKLDWDLRLPELQNRVVVGGKRFNLPMPNDDAMNSLTKTKHLELLDDEVELDVLYKPILRTNLSSTLSEFEHKSSLPDGSGGASKGSNVSKTLDRGRGLLALELRPYVESLVLIDQGVHTDEAEFSHRIVHNYRPNEQSLTIKPKRLYKVSPLSLLSSIHSPAPLGFWNQGIQYVSHFDSPGRNEWLQRARFAENGRCGYVLKPKATTANVSSSPVTASSTASKTRELIFHVICGRQLPLPVVSEKLRPIFVKLSLLNGHNAQVEKQTKCVNNNGLDPTWNERITFEVDAEELLKRAGNSDDDFCVTCGTMLVVEVYGCEQDMTELLCGSAVPLNCIRWGLRWVPLWTMQANNIPWAGLVVHVESKYVKGQPNPPPPTGAPDSPLQRRNSIKDALKEQRRNRRLSVAPSNPGSIPVLQRRASLNKQ